MVGEAGPDLLNRVVGLVAQLGLVPVDLRMHRLGDMVTLAIVQDGIDPHRAAIVAEKIRALVSVSAVELTYDRISVEETP